jgi:hypothetical protein
MRLSVVRSESNCLDRCEDRTTGHEHEAAAHLKARRGHADTDHMQRRTNVLKIVAMLSLAAEAAAVAAILWPTR